MYRATRYFNYTAAWGDTFDSIAFSMYTQERMAHHIILANPDHCGTVVFEGGEVLRIPVLERSEAPEALPPWRRSGRESDGIPQQ